METKRGLETYLRTQRRFFSIMDKNHTGQVGELKARHTWFQLGNTRQAVSATLDPGQQIGRFLSGERSS